MIQQCLTIYTGITQVGSRKIEEPFSCGLAILIVIIIIIQCRKTLSARSLLPAAAMALPLPCLGCVGGI
jgi:hypothetical protein